MRAGRKLLTVGVVYAVVIALVAALVGAGFATDASDYRGADMEAPAGMSGFGRRGGAFSPADYSAAGKQTLLPAGYKEALSGGGVTLYFNEETGAVAVRNGEGGSVWLSNPADADSETLVGGETRDALYSQVTVGYYSSAGQMVYLDSYNASVKSGGMSYKASGDGLTVSYHISRSVFTIDDIPSQLTDERFEELLERMERSDATEMKKYYRKHSLSGISGSKARKALINKYPAIERGDVWSVDTVTDRIVAKVRALLDKIGYTAEELERDHEENGITAKPEEKAYFDVTLIYTLDGGRLNVTLDGSKLAYAESMPPVEVRLLEFFGAANREAEGYLLVPDGSGGLIHYNNGRESVPALDISVYGDDASMAEDGKYQAAEQVLLPAFGAKTGSGAFLCLMRGGASLGRICAAVSGMTYSYNRVWATYNTTRVSQMSLTTGSDSDIIVREKNPYRGDFSQEYIFLEDESADYSGMAAAARERLTETGELTEKSLPDAFPLDLEFLGAVPRRKVVAGLSLTLTEEMTTFSEAGDIVERLISAGAAPTGVVYEGWLTGGTAQKSAEKVKPAKALGGKKGLNSFLGLLKGRGIPFYGEVYFTSVFRTGGGYSKRTDSPRKLSGDIAVTRRYDIMNRYKTGDPVYRVSPGKLGGVVGKFTDKAGKVGLPGVASADLGHTLGSDFSAKKPVSRPDAERIEREQLEKLAKSFSLKLSAPNLYALGSAGSVKDLPVDDSWFSVVDESVPFLPMCLSGLVSYTASPLNLAPDYKTALLEAVEYGAGFSYLLMEGEPGLLSDTSVNGYTTGRAADWVPVIAEDYVRAAKELATVAGRRMVRHSRVGEKLYRSEYENGAAVLVNYGDGEAEYEGHTVPAKDYIVIG